MLFNPMLTKFCDDVYVIKLQKKKKKVIKHTHTHTPLPANANYSWVNVLHNALQL